MGIRGAQRQCRYIPCGVGEPVQEPRDAAAALPAPAVLGGEKKRNEVFIALGAGRVNLMG